MAQLRSEQLLRTWRTYARQLTRSTPSWGTKLGEPMSRWKAAGKEKWFGNDGNWRFTVSIVCMFCFIVSCIKLCDEKNCYSPSWSITILWWDLVYVFFQPSQAVPEKQEAVNHNHRNNHDYNSPFFCQRNIALQQFVAWQLEQLCFLQLWNAHRDLGDSWCSSLRPATKMKPRLTKVPLCPNCNKRMVHDFGSIYTEYFTEVKTFWNENYPPWN